MTSTHSYYIRTSFYKLGNDERVIETSFKIFVAEILLFKCLSKAFVIIWKILVKYSNATKLQKKKCSALENWKIQPTLFFS